MGEPLCTPPEITSIATVEIGNLLPKRSQNLYEKQYKQFMEWKESKCANSFSENVVLAFFSELSDKMKSSTLWKTYSMLRSTINLKHNIDLASYNKLRAFLKRKSYGFQAKKSKILTSEHISKFINEAPDNIYLATKVVLIVGTMGACCKHELWQMKVDHIQDLGAAILINVPDTKTKLERKFTITGHFCTIFKRYFQLRPANVENNHFFLNYQKGRCTKQIMGLNKLGSMPKQVATFLKLQDSEKYTGHCFRRTSATMLVDAGADVTTLKRHGGWKSTEVAEGYIDNSLNNKINIANKILNEINNPMLQCSSETVISKNLSSVPNFTFNNCTNNNITINLNKVDNKENVDVI